MAQVVEHLLRRLEALSTNPSSTNKEKRNIPPCHKARGQNTIAEAIHLASLTKENCRRK
jgi:hypothetical protein